MSKKLFCAALLAFHATGYASNDPKELLHKNVTLHLASPQYENGEIRTDEGGVICSEGFRLQGSSFVYVNKVEDGKTLHFVLVKDNIMLDYGGQIFIGKELRYDFTTQTGYILDAITSVDPWFIRGKKILLFADKSCEIKGASVSTSDDNHIVWEMTAENIYLTKDKQLKTKNIKFKVGKVPIFWLPYFKSDLTSFKDTPVRYKLDWDEGQGPQISLRYRVYSWNRFNMYLRGDYRYARGPGVALEMDYTSEDKVTVFKSKNYFANDTFYNDDNPNQKMKRFRLQGIYKTHSKDGRAEFDLAYDRYSDKNMPGDFKNDSFELNVSKQTYAIARYYHDGYIAGFNVKPRINGFQGFKQELPRLNMHVKSLKLGPTPFVLDNHFSLAYLDYTYSNQLTNMPPDIAAVLRNFNAVRGATRQEISLPLHFHGIHFKPSFGVLGIAYNNGPLRESVNQAALTYNGHLDARFSREFNRYNHVILPYVHYEGLSKPLKSSEEVYIFDINDGYHAINSLRAGINTLLYKKDDSPLLPAFSCDLYALGFTGTHTFSTPFPKAGFNMVYSKSNLQINADVRWNFNNHVLDFSNIIFSYTFNESCALSIEYRHRSRFDWRKDNHDNFILDVTKPIETLLDSPLSDGRNTLLTKGELRFNSRWWCQIQMHNGWGRSNQPGYTEAKVDLFTILSSAWRLKLSYMYTTRGGSHGSIGLDLIR